MYIHVYARFLKFLLYPFSISTLIRYVQELNRQNPQLLHLINQNQAEFLRIVNEPLSDEERQSIDGMLANAGITGGQRPMPTVEVW